MVRRTICGLFQALKFPSPTGERSVVTRGYRENLPCHRWVSVPYRGRGRCYQYPEKDGHKTFEFPFPTGEGALLPNDPIHHVYRIEQFPSPTGEGGDVALINDSSINREYSFRPLPGKGALLLDWNHEYWGDTSLFPSPTGEGGVVTTFSFYFPKWASHMFPSPTGEGGVITRTSG